MKERIEKSESESGSFEISAGFQRLILKKLEEAEETHESYLNNLYKIRDCDCGGEDKFREIRMLRQCNVLNKLFQRVLSDGVLVKYPEKQNLVICLGSVFTASLIAVGKKEIIDKDEKFILDGYDLPREGDRPRIIDHRTSLGRSFLGKRKGDAIKVKDLNDRWRTYVVKEIFFPW